MAEKITGALYFEARAWARKGWQMPKEGLVERWLATLRTLSASAASSLAPYGPSAVFTWGRTSLRRRTGGSRAGEIAENWYLLLNGHMGS